MDVFSTVTVDMMAQTMLGCEINQLKLLGSERHINVCCLLGCITVSGKYGKTLVLSNPTQSYSDFSRFK